MANPTPTPEQLAAAAEQLANAPAPGMAPPDEQGVAARLAAAQSAAPGGVTDVDPAALLAMIQGLQARLDEMEAEKAAGQAPPLVAVADTIRDLLTAHAAHNPATDHSDVRGLADDLADAAKNALDSGDGTELAKIGERLGRAVAKVHPGPGDHHYLRQAEGFIRDHLPDAIANLKPRSKPAAGAIGSDRAPAKVIAGSVTG